MPLRTAMTLAGLSALLSACAGQSEYAGLQERAASHSVNREALREELYTLRAQSRSRTVVVDGKTYRVRVIGD